MAGRVGPAASKATQARRIEVIRALWPTDCTLDAIGERLGIAGKTVALLAKRAGLPSRHALNQPVPKPGLFSPEPRPGARKPAPTPEQVAKTVTDRRPSPPQDRPAPRGGGAAERAGDPGDSKGGGRDRGDLGGC